MNKPKCNIDELFMEAKRKESYLKISAPMVRYSKLQFRRLLRCYGVDLAFTPMILADSFCQSSKARAIEFSTNQSDTPLIVQFAAKTAYDFVGASELVYPYADGVDLNCGCPQRWAMKDGYGCSLLGEPEIIYDLVRNFKNRISNSFSISIKIRLLNDIKDTIELCRRLEKCSVNFITVHGRKIWQKSSEPVDMDALKDIKDSLTVPFVANGSIKSLQDADNMYQYVNCDGVMAAQGLLTNPAMFADENITPLKCIKKWIDICYSQKKSMSFQCFHHHLVFMLEKVLRRKQRQVFNNLSNYDLVYEFLKENLDVVPDILDQCVVNNDVICTYKDVDYNDLKKSYGINVNGDLLLPNSESVYDSNTSQGKYFISTISKSDCDLDHMDGTLFDE